MSEPRPAEDPTVYVGWAQLLWGLSVANALLITAISLYYFGRPVLYVIFIVMFSAGRWFMRRGGNLGAIALIAAFLMFMFFNVPFIFPALPVPASSADFFFSVAMLVIGITGVVAGVAVIGRRDEHPSSVPIMIGLAGGAVVVLAVFLGVGMRLVYDSPSPHPGDLRLTASQLEYSKQRLRGRAEAASVHIVNEDPTLHTFTIDELDVNLVIPAGTSARVTFDADAGKYTFYCRPFTMRMSGTLTIR